MSAAESPTTSTDSVAGTMHPGSTIPSSPMDDSDTTKMVAEKAAAEQSIGNGETESMDDLEGMDGKAKALMHLLKTSSVSRNLSSLMHF